MRNILVVGAGISGLSFARSLVNRDKSANVIIFESSNKIGGNVSEINIDGTLVHEHGPHLFHTNSKKVWDFVNSYEEFVPYFHKVGALVDGQTIPIPFNFNSIDLIFSKKQAQELKGALIENYGFGTKVSILKLSESQDKKLQFLSSFIFDKIFKGYTEKQWGIDASKVNKSVLSRVPVNISKDNRYFSDLYQGLPLNGYSNFCKSLSNHKNIEVLLNKECTFDDISEKYDAIICTAPLDQFFNYKFGVLEYRSLNFKRVSETTNSIDLYPVQTNFPNNFDFTRIVRYGVLPNQTQKDIFMAEYPQDFEIGKNHRYYPINNEINDDLFKKYKEYSKKKNILLCGRLGLYKYYNMDQAIASALKVADDFLAS